jgi:hypothetical protein
MNSRVATVCALLAVAAAAAATASAQVSDDCESYAVGAFPAPLWLDPGLVDPQPPNPPDPSAVVAATPDVLGALTNAVSIIDAVAPTQGIYTALTIAPRVRITCDVRIDQWCDVPSTPQDDWGVWVQVGVSMPGRDLCCTDENMGVYASAMDRGWRMWWKDAPFSVSDISLNAPIDLGVWYTVEAEYDISTGWAHIRIWDTASGAPLADHVATPTSWAPSGAPFDTVAFVDGELGSENTIGHLTVIDNIEVDAACYADCDGSGGLDFFDFLCFQNLFAASAPRADCDGSGGLDFFDFLCFQDGFAAGCP